MSSLESRVPTTERTLDALLLLREVEDQDVRLKLQQKQVEIARIEREISLLEKRCDSVIRRGGDRVLDERILLDALLRIVLDRRRQMERCKGQAKRLLNEYLRAKAHRDVAREAHERRRLERRSQEERRADQAAGDLAASADQRETGSFGEESCES